MMPETPDPLEAMARAMFDRWFEHTKALATDEQFRESEWFKHRDEFIALATDALQALLTTPWPEEVIDAGWATNPRINGLVDAFHAMIRKMLETA
jgi:hypothetical protein